jgi:nitrogenase molybdenum-iron protein alpha/beta subunit
VNVKVNHVIPGGSGIDDIRDSLSSRANLLWCPSYIGETLERLASKNGLPIAGYTPPYGLRGTTTWLAELANVLPNRMDILDSASVIRERIANQVEMIKKNTKGIRGFVSGGPGRVPGLLGIMADLDVEVVAAGLYWPHPNSKVKDALKNVANSFPIPIKKIVVAPSLYELEEIATSEKIDFWMGGYQEQHVCKRHGIPFIPTTVYSKSHQCYEGVITVGEKIEKALEGFDFVANVFTGIEGIR